MKRRILILFLIVVLVVANISPLCLAESYLPGEIAYLESVIPSYFSAAGISISDNLQLTQGYPIEGNPNSSMYFLFDGNLLLGRFVVETSVGGYSSSFVADSNSAINRIISGGIPFAVASLNDRLVVMHTENEIVPVVGNDDELLAYLQGSLSGIYGELETPVMSEVDLSNVASPAIDTSGFTASLNVPYVENETIYDGPNQDVGLCWAACVCSIGRFNGGASLSPTGLYNTLKNQYGGYPTGTSSWVLKGYRHFNMNNVGYYATITWSTLYNKLSSSQPVTFVIKNTSSGLTHAVVCEAFIGANGYATYRFMDPNVSGDIFVTNNSANLSLTNFPYNNGCQSFNTVVGLYYVA